MNQSKTTAWIETGTIRHLRFPFSFFLLPVFLFALSQAPEVNWGNALLIFVVLHLFIFPSSNGYNSYQDKDESSIGGLKHPPKVTRNLFYITLLFDIIGVALAAIISIYTAVFVLVFVIMSRLYSYRKVRLKKYPILSFLIIFIFQGAWVYLISLSAFGPFNLQMILEPATLTCMAISSLFIGSMYPLTQIYQHEADKKDGVITISYVLGYRGTFLFSALLFVIATILMILYFDGKGEYGSLILFAILLAPAVWHLARWNLAVKKDVRKANFENTMRTNILTSTVMNTYFLLLISNNYLQLF